MYRGRPPPRGGYPPAFEGRGPRPYPAPSYRDDRSRPRPPYHPGFHPDSYRRSPPRRRYPSPASGSHRGGEYWAGGPPRERSPSPRGPLDHNLVITVGNELIGPSGSAPSRHHDRDYPPRPEYERGRSRPRSRSPERSRAKSRGRSKSRSPDRSRAGRSKSRSPDRSRAKSRGRSKSRARSKSRPRSQSRSPGRSRAKSRGRSRSKSRSLDRSRAKSRGRSKSRHHSRSRSRSRSRGLSYGRIRSAQRSRSSSSSSSSGEDSNDKFEKGFRELETARRRKELEEMLSLPTKSILKKRNDSEDSPSLRSSDSPRGLDGSSMSRVADQLLQAVKGMEPHMVASMLSELRSDPQMAHRAGLDAEIKEILHLLGGPSGAKAQEKVADDIDDEERFLYGDSEEPKPQPVSEPVRLHGLDLYGDVTEEALYGDYPPQKPVISQMYGLPPGASPHIQVPPTMGEMDMRYASQPSISPDRNITVQVPNPAIPPGTEPLEEGERQALEEYEKIQDLLKTIGLDLGVTEISKMAARTKERLHGNKPPPKTPTRRKRYSSGSSDDSRGRRRRSHSGSSSSTSSRSCSRGRGGSWSSDDGRRKSSVPSKAHKDSRELKAEPQAVALPPQTEPPLQTPNPKILPPHPGMPIPSYPPSQVHGLMPPNFPPPAYGQYGNYLPYMHQQWPPMYPPPNMCKRSLKKVVFVEDGSLTELLDVCFHAVGLLNVTPACCCLFVCLLVVVSSGVVKSSVQDGEGETKGNVSSHEKRVSEEQNNESQKQKVLEEREKLKQERDIRMKKKEYLMKELERLRKQQGELLRKKRREKGGHKDPLLQEISRLQEEVMAQISNLRKEHEAAEKKRNEIEKVAHILGLVPSDRPRRTAKLVEDQEDEPPPPLPPLPEKKKREADWSPEGRHAASSSTIKQSPVMLSSSSSRASPDKQPVATLAPPLTPPPQPFEYYDAGNHWCKNCNITSGSMFDFFTHLHSKTHRKTLDPYDRPWASTPTKISKNLSSEEKLTKPAKGSEFLLPVRGFFCLLCKEFYGDAICAEEHVTTHAHNEKYKKQMYENPLYEQRRNLDRQAGLASENSGKKRKHEDEDNGKKDKEEKSKHKKEKKEKKKEEDNATHKGEKVKEEEEEEEKPKSGKKEEDFKNAKNLEEERPSYSKKDEDEKYKSSKKEDKYRHSREEEERSKYSRRDEDDRYKYSREEEYRHRYRRDDDDDRYDDRPKFGPREYRPKYDKDRDEGKLKHEKESSKKVPPGKPAGKPEITTPEPPPKPYELPKILCGPSPAMRAKLRKQSLETGKPAPATMTPTFGKFTWKKRENVLAKEAEKVAAEFIKEDEAAAKQNPISVEDSFAKSMAVAKEIAQKLGGQQNMPPPWVSNSANRGRIRPNLPAPAGRGNRRTAMMGRPAPLNTFLSIRPQNLGLQGQFQKEPLFSDGLMRAMNAQNALLEGKSQPPAATPETVKATPAPTPAPAPVPAPAPAPVPVQAPVPAPVPVPVHAPMPAPAPGMSRPPPFDAKHPPPMSRPSPFDAKHPPPMSRPPPFKAKPAPPVCNPAPPVCNPAPPVYNPAPPVSKPAPMEVKLAQPVVTSAPSQTIPAQSVAKPTQPTLIKIVSDVAAPGVPENEQTRTVFVKPPPLKSMADVAQKSEKLKSNLAAAKAQDLFDIFYSSVGQSGPSSITKPVTDVRADESSTNKSQLSALQAPKPQPQSKPVTQSQPPSVVCKSPQPDSSGAQTQPDSPGPKTQPDSPGPKTQVDSQSPESRQESDIQIASVWSLQPTPATTPEVAPSETQKTQPQLNPPAQSEAQSVPQNQSSTPESGSQITPQTKPANLEPTPQTQFQPKPATHIQTNPQPDQDNQPQSHLETHSSTAPEPEPKPSPKTRGKRTPPAPRPVRQTRSQTRYQTRQQQQSQSEPEPEPEPEPELPSGDSDSVTSDPKGLDTSNPGSRSEPEEGAPREEDSKKEVTPETLGLPSDMTSLNFDYDFNFE
ncbi:LOW QUALITY PROTEIN: zinc finger protein 318 [Epinephelus moara]|uniref:LOW QUALITY PROTEIN: zinc finger protein 318 n=1 Tax=Epinephelus moara TaxID=300413 RepID=UPI00214E8CB0|nr:LOW QUALITY PROTEIN: zinc finger protein 318 [Epinephelus moara]